MNRQLLTNFKKFVVSNTSIYVIMSFIATLKLKNNFD